MDGTPLVEPVSRDALEEGLEWVRAAPGDRGRLELIVSRPAEGERALHREAQLDRVMGLVGDTWHVRPSSSTADGSPHPDKQLTLVNARLAQLVAGGRERMSLAGDQLYMDLDLSVVNLPPGSLLAIGEAVVEITEPPHLGCAKFVARFGQEAMRLVNSPVGRSLRLRGANARVKVPGRVRLGDAVCRHAGPATV